MENLAWVNTFVRLQLNKKWEISQEISERVYMFPWRQSQFIERTQAQYSIAKGWSVNGGFMWSFQSYPKNPFDQKTYQLSEFRPHLGAVYRQEITDKITLNHRYRSEFRIFEEEKNFYRFESIRFRYRLEFQYSPIQLITLKIGDEVFLNADFQAMQNVFDQNRASISLLFHLTPIFSLELGYFNLFSTKSATADLYDQHTFQLGFYTDLKVKKRTSNTYP